MANKTEDRQQDSREAAPDLASVLAGAGKRRRGPRWLLRLFVLVVLICGGVGAYLYFGHGETQYVYTTQPAKRGDLTVLVTATGSVEPTEKVDVSSELSGTVRSVNVDYNSAVKKGDVLAVLDTNKLEADVQSAKAKVNSSEANVLKADAEMKAARNSFDRLQSLVQNRVSSQQDLDAAQYKFDAAAAAKNINEADVLASKADLKLAEVNLAKARIVSPIDGIVLTRSVDPGATVAASLSAPVLFTIAGDLRRMELQVDVDEADVGQVAVGQSASFSVDAFPNRKFPAEIRNIRYASETISNVVTYMAVLTVENNDMLLRPGMTATADITVKSLKAQLLIPNAALRYSPPAARESRSSIFNLFRPPRMRSFSPAPTQAGSKRTVWAMRNGRPQPVAIEIGATDGQFTELVSGGVSEGDELITDATAGGR
ncbi:MAG: efflux transporter periplasmic adaptor subunit [Rhizobiales bacterium 63-7]|nr:efflux RND transporter periplasmic adaptor subunit [Hyphomicrobiales bacterium]OJU70474.1 MAG: efflux transporter periplasmic adaptor subunit [Rhizobiales bacterium 63-7]